MDDDEENFNLMLEQNKRDMIDYISNNNFDIIQLKNNISYKRLTQIKSLNLI